MNRQMRIRDDNLTGIGSDILNLEKDRLAHYDSVIRKLFFACEYCDGALIHLADCVVCKRATIRKCTHCNTELQIPHSMCEVSGIFESNVSSTLEVRKC